MRRIATYFFGGLVFLLPIVGTIYILAIVFLRIDQIFRFDIPGLGFLLILGVVTLTGFLVSTFLARGLANAIDNLFGRLPVVKMIYTSIKDLMDAFVGDRKGFDKPVLVQVLPGSGIRIMGFLTRENLPGVAGTEHVAVYIPQSYNFGGNVMIVPRDQVSPLKIASGRVMAFIISGGVSGL